VSFDAVALAQAGAQVIVAAMATETWTQLRARLGQLFGRGDDAQRQQALDELDETSTALAAAPTDEDARDAQVELRALLRTRLRADPELAAQFAALVEEVAARVGAPTQATVTQRASADRGGTVIQAGRDATIGRRPPAGRSPLP
jgi:Spy/CpxP family protein refolding chaperone